MFSFLLTLFAVVALPLVAQDNYEVQVYGAETLAPGRTMVELHNNLTIGGGKKEVNGVYPSNHAWHETIEITQGLSSWSEVGFYIFTSCSPVYGCQWVGDHIRPRVRAPESWHWPVGASLSLEVGYQRARFSEDTWTWEIRPIIDKQLGKWYLSFNPTLDRSFHGPSVRDGLTFSPSAKASYKIAKRIDVGIEYYGGVGPLRGFNTLRDQMQQILPSVDIDLGPNWELNFGVGVGVTQSTDHLLAKMIIGHRFNFGSRESKKTQ